MKSSQPSVIPATPDGAPNSAGAADAADASGVAVLDRACAILHAFQPDDDGLTLAQLAARTALYKSTLLRLADSLIHHRLLVRLEDGRYRIGPACFALGALYQRSLRLGDILLPLMRELAQLSGESAAFYVRDRDLRVCLHRVDSQHAIRFHVREGDVLPLGSGSGGLTLLAFAGEPGARYARIRAAGYCVSVGERDRDTAGISAPVFGVRQALRGVLTLAGPSSRVDRAFIDRVLPEFLSIAARSSEALGGDAEQLRDAMQQR